MDYKFIYFIIIYCDNYKLNYQLIVKLSKICKNINIIISKRFTKFYKLKEKIVNNSLNDKNIQYTRYGLSSIFKIISYRPYEKAIIISEIVHHIFKNISFNNTLQEQIISNIDCELYMEVIDLCINIKKSLKKLQTELQYIEKSYINNTIDRYSNKINNFIELNKLDYANQEIISDSIELKKIEDIHNEINIVNQFINL